MNRLLTGELRRHADGLNACEREAERLMAGLDDAAFAWRPAPDRWSIAECIVHLTLTLRLYLPPIDDALAAARERGLLRQGPYRHGLLGALMLRSMEPPPRMRLRIPTRAIEPSREIPLDEARAVYLASHDELRARFAAAEGVDLGRARLASPLASWLKLSVGHAFGIIVAHERRHLWQAARVRAAPGFPAPAGSRMEDGAPRASP
jgi:hypothetical protein